MTTTARFGNWNMETLLSPDFWSAQLTAAFEAQAILIPLLILAFWFGVLVAHRSGKSRTRREDQENFESRLRLARDQNSDEAKFIVEVASKIQALRKLNEAKAKRSDVESIIEEADAKTRALAMANQITNHILSADNPAIRD